MTKKVIISVISDLVTDQRVQKVATTLHNNGNVVMLIGAKRKVSHVLPDFPFTTKRISLLFQKGFLMYAEWNIRLFFYLFFQKADILLANDLDTLLPNFLHSKLRNKKLVYDCHEYFTEQEEVANRSFVKKIWTGLEQFIFPKLKNVYTVNDSIATLYKQKYKVEVQVIKNLPKNITAEVLPTALEHFFTEKLSTKKILLAQGAGFNANRGLEELIDSVDLLPNEYVLVIVGKGLIIEEAKKRANNLRTFFIDPVTPKQLKTITTYAYLGFSLDKGTCLNYEYSLPNKIFDYIQASVPVIASNRVEVAKVVNNNVGLVIDSVTAGSIANAILQINDAQHTNFKLMCAQLANTYTWENQEPALVSIFNNLK